MVRVFCSLFLLALSVALQAQSIWSDIAERDIPAGERLIIPRVYRTVSVDLNALQSLLNDAPERFTPAANKSELPVLTLPMPDGRTASFRLNESPVMAPALQDKYPETRCYTGYGIDDPTALLKCDLTPWGFHAMVLSATHSTLFIDPYSHGDKNNYVVYFKKDYPPGKDNEGFYCETETTDFQQITLNSSAAKAQGDCQLRRYRLALACTGEYASFHGGTVALTLAAMNTTMNRVNGVYENDFAVTMQLIPNNDQIIYLNSATDPYNNGNGSTMLGQNQNNLTSVIGSANFDIGHVVSTGGGGVAGLGVVCNNNSKARGVTGGGSPIGDPFDIDYVAHEMGHQFSGNHTFNGTAGSCNGNGSTQASVEPGSGTTIMAYAGICGAQNVQSNSDDYFHAFNVQEINNFTVNGNGNTCAVKINSNNNNPVVDGGADYIIPKSTPFALTATGSDVNNDMLTFCWEQMDAAVTTSPPVSTSTTGPLFRSFKGTASPTRYFPRLSDLVSNTNYPWEKLPSVARTMNFRVVARDNHGGAGCTDEDDVVVTVAGTAGPFTVTVPNTNVLWYVGETKTVTWDVNNTNAAPVNCANVRILLSTDGGFNYPVVLAANVPNTGSANVLVPNNLSNTCRVKVEAVGNIFFDISNQNFRIQLPPVPTFTLVTNTNALQACAGDTLLLSADLGSILGFSDSVVLTLNGAPAGATFNINPNPALPGNSAQISIYDLAPGAAGTYNMTVQATSGSIIQNAGVQLTLLPGAPAAVATVSPANGAIEQSLSTDLTWNTAAFADNYFVEVATSPSFAPASVVFSQNTANATIQTSTLQPGGVYYWHVRPSNSCGAGDFSPVIAFQTGKITCGQAFNSTDVPQVISQSIDTAISVLNIAENKIIADVNVTFQVNHTWVGDLDARLVAPDGTTILLFDRPGVPATSDGCEGNNINAIFDDSAILTSDDFDATCEVTIPAISGTYQPIDALSALNGMMTAGEWKIIVKDNVNQDGGSIIAWGLNFCFADTIPTGTIAINTPLMVPAGGTGAIEATNLSFTGAAGPALYTLLSLPQHGTLLLDGMAMAYGDAFTQADIDAGLVSYEHNGDAAVADEFLFDAVDLTAASWVQGATFQIIIVQNNLAATAAESQAVLCPNSATGEITVDATGLDGQYQYSINGGPNQTSNVFTGLPAGDYTVVVTGQFGFTTTTDTITLSDPAAIQASADVVDDDVTVTASGGTGVFQYSLDGVMFQSSNVFENLPNGFYTITVQDENGCTTTVETIVAVNTLLANLVVQSQVSCFGGSNGAVSAAVAGGQMPYSFSLNGGAFQPQNTFTGLPTGTYTVEVKDNQGFTITTNEVTITSPPAIVVSANTVLNVITVTASGGVGALQYSINGADFQPGNVFSGLPNGTYTITVRDANGCIVTTQATVNVPALAITLISETTTILCFGDQTGALEISATGGIPPYEYALNGGAYQSNNAFSGLNGGPHTVAVRDAAGTVTETTFSFNQPAALIASVTLTGNDAQFLATGGTTPYTFVFNGPQPPVNLPNGNYMLTVVDANGCSDVENFTVNIPPLSLAGQITDIDYCNGQAMIELAATGGEAPYEYSLNGGPFQSSNVFTIFPGANSVRVRDVTGTIVQIPVPLQLNPPLEADASVSNDTIIASAQLGTPPYMYSINGLPSQSSPVFPGVPNGDYMVVVEDANGCADTVFVLVLGIVNPATEWGLLLAPNPSAGLFRLEMQQAPAELRAEVFDVAGRNLRSLHFAPGSGTFITTLDLLDLPQGTYLLRLTDGKRVGAVRLSIVR